MAVAHMHAVGIAHRDIKPENASVRETAEHITFKLIDFDVSIQCKPDQLSDNVCGTFPFAAPEIHLQKRYRPHPTDVWSLGVMLGEILTGVHLMEKACSLKAYRQRYQQESMRRGRAVRELDMYRYLAQKINDRFLKEGTTSHLIQNNAFIELHPLVGPMAALLERMIRAPVAHRATTQEVLESPELQQVRKVRTSLEDERSSADSQSAEAQSPTQSPAGFTISPSPAKVPVAGKQDEVFEQCRIDPVLDDRIVTWNEYVTAHRKEDLSPNQLLAHWQNLKILEEDVHESATPQSQSPASSSAPAQSSSE
mmetsp:Transcript_42870/g.76915  ORF Transcript_42870/g.76915 Transcript_42870/m.76915 type:complete len:310 (-) Transcript_42870:143-1072(-)